MASAFVPAAHLTRAQLCGRIWACRRALEELRAQELQDDAGSIPGHGALALSLAGYEGELRQRDTVAGRMPHEVTVVMAGRPMTGRPSEGR